MVFKCKLCGADMDIELDALIGECEVCEASQTLPRLDSDKRISLYNRANDFFRRNAFDEAAAVYETILKADKTDAEAHWLLALCRYGVVYVKENGGNKRVPVCNRTQRVSIYEDRNYKKAVGYADESQKALMEIDAELIDSNLKTILSVSKTVKPVDIFICCRETDDEDQRTQDSVLAQELYYLLKNEGLKVFFPLIALADKPLEQYEAYIYASLQSARVMVVLGTRPSHFIEPWVKNEWCRYLNLIKNGENKTLIPVCSDMSAADLPSEFLHLRAMDMNAPGFTKDIIAKICELTTQKSNDDATLSVLTEDSKDLSSAAEDVLTDISKDDTYAYAQSQTVLTDTDAAYGDLKTQDSNALHNMQTDDGDGLHTRNQETIKKSDQKDTSADSRKRSVLLGDDSNDAIMLNYQIAISEGGRDEKLKRAKLIGLGVCGGIIVVLGFLLFLSIRYFPPTVVIGAIPIYILLNKHFISPYRIYAKARHQLELENYAAAAETYRELGDFLDSLVQVPAVRYAYGEQLLAKGDLKAAAEVFSDLKSYRDAYDRVLQVRYSEAENLYAKKKYNAAAAIFIDIREYRDSRERAREAQYAEALQLADRRDHSAAAALFKKLGNYKDSQEKYAAYQKQKPAQPVKTEVEAQTSTFDRGDAKQISQTSHAELKGTQSQQEAHVPSVPKSESGKSAMHVRDTEPAMPEIIIPVTNEAHNEEALRREAQYASALQSITEMDFYNALKTFAKLGDYKESKALVADILLQLRSLMSISAGEAFTVGLRACGSVVAVGDNYFSQCNATLWHKVTAISAGRSHTVGILTNGTVAAIGYKTGGQCDVGRWYDMTAVSAGGRHTVGIRADGTVAAVGSNVGGQCDVNEWRGIAAISAGSDHTVGLKRDGTVVACGINSFGKCDVHKWRDIVAVSAGALHTVGLKKDGTVVAVGSNDNGQCDVDDFSNITSISAGERHTVALRKDGTVAAVGYNHVGQCEVADFNDIIAIAAGALHTVGLKPDGTVIAVGSNNSGECNVGGWNLTQLTHKRRRGM